MKNKTIWMGVLLLAAGIGLVRAQKPEARFDNLVRDDFFAGMGGDFERFDRAMKTCEEALAKDPKNAAALVWHGAGLYVRSGIAFRKGDTAGGLELHRRSLKEMENAVALEPNSVQTRIPRAAILLSGARFVDDSIAKPLVEIAVGDYEKVLELEKPYFDNVGSHGRGELLGGLADGYRRLGKFDKSREYLQRIVHDLPGTAYEKQAQRWLADLRAVGKQERFCLGCHMGQNP